MAIHFSCLTNHFWKNERYHWTEQQTQTKADNGDGTLSTVHSARPLNESTLTQNGCHMTVHLVGAQWCCGWSKLVTHAGYNSPFYSPKWAIKQTGQGATTEEHWRGCCCGKLEGADVDAGTITHHND